MMDPSLLTDTVVGRLRSTGQIRGLVLVQPELLNNGRASSENPYGSRFSPATRMPFPISTGGSAEWNPAGTSLARRRLPFPAVAATGQDGAKILSAARQDRAEGLKWPRRALDFYFDQGPAGLRSEQCLGDSSCLPLGGLSAWATLGAPGDGPAVPSSNGSSNSSRLSSPAAGARAETGTATLAATAAAPVPGYWPRVDGAVLLAAPLDADGMFRSAAAGGDAGVGPMVALLAAVKALGAAGAWRLQRPIVPLLLQGEQWGRMGSRTLGLDLAEFSCSAGQTVSAADSPTGRAYCKSPLRWDLAFQNLSLPTAHAAVALAGIGSNASLPAGAGPGAPRTLFAHSPDPSAPGAASLLASLQRAAGDAAGPLSREGLPPVQVQASSSRGGVPPTGLDSLVLAGNGRGGQGAVEPPAMPALAPRTAVLSTGDAATASGFLGSTFDDEGNTDPRQVAAAAQLLASAAWELARNSSDPGQAPPADGGLQVDAQWVAEMLRCVLQDPLCDLLRAELGWSSETMDRQMAVAAPHGRLSLFVGVWSQPYTPGNTFVLQPSVVELLAWRVLANATAAPSQQTGVQCREYSSDCDESVGRGYDCFYGKCIRNSAHLHPATSPALRVLGIGRFSVNHSMLTDDDRLWTEPYWSPNIGVKLFRTSHPGTAAGLFVGGLVAVGLVTAGVYWGGQLLVDEFGIQ